MPKGAHLPLYQVPAEGPAHYGWKVPTITVAHNTTTVIGRLSAPFDLLILNISRLIVPASMAAANSSLVIPLPGSSIGIA